MTERWLLLAYSCSGFAGLVYEIAWTRLLTLHLGHTTAAVSTVTAAFMGGLGLGGVLGGRMASTLSRRQALWTYALLELVVAVAALSIAGGLTLLTPLFAWAYGEDGAGLLFSTVRIASSFGVLLVPGVALGATFPMAVRVAVTSPTRPGGAAGRLYGANTAGAAIGSLAAGFVLIPIIGLTSTTLTGMAASAASIALALSFVRRELTVAESEDGSTRTRIERQDARPNRTRPRTGRAAANVDGWDTERRRYGLAAAVLALTGFATFAHEVVWTRVLALVVGPSLYAFAATLTSFITGLALGSFAGASLAERGRRPAVALALTLIATAVAGCVSVALVGGSLLEIGAGTLGRSATRAGIALPHLAIAFGLTFPIALGLGVAFPLSLDLAGSRDATPAQRLGVLYAVNTAAAVVGALVAGFITISAVGLRTSLLVAITSLLLGAAVLVVSGRFSSRDRVAVLLPLALAVAWMATSPGWDREWLAAGGYLYTRFVPPGIDRRAALTAGTLMYYREGATGTVSVKALTGARSLSIDGKVDASTARDMLTQKLLAHLPLLLHPNPRQVGIVGLGSGVTLASALVHPVVSVDVVEISPEVVEASMYFADVNRRALDDPRTRLVRGDGRTHFSLTSRLYDVVISEPSNPWMAGVAALFTQEFFQRVRSRLAASGIFCQWAHTYDVSDADLRSIVATFRAVFPDGTMWLAGDGDLLLVGSTAPLEPRLEDMSTAWQRPGVGEDLRTVGMREPFALLSLFVGGSRETSRYGAGSALQTDDRTALEFSGPFAVFAGVPSNHAHTLRGLIDGGQQPSAVARALTGATASQWRDRGAMLMGADAADSAYRAYATALDLDPTDMITLEGFVRAATAARQEDDAERRLRALIRSRGDETAATGSDPLSRPESRGLTSARVALADLLGMRGRFDEATVVATEATRLAPGDPTAWEQLASLQADRGDADRLRQPGEVLRREFPDRAASWYFAASERFLRGDVASALPLVRRAIELDANYADAHNLLGAILATAGDVSAGRDAFRTSLRLDPRDAVTYVNLAQLELAAGQRDVAADLFAEALSLDPNSVSARDGLAQARSVR
jgi:spermidine synthase